MMRMQGVVVRLLVVWCWVAVGCTPTNRECCPDNEGAGSGTRCLQNCGVDGGRVFDDFRFFTDPPQRPIEVPPPTVLAAPSLPAANDDVPPVSAPPPVSGGSVFATRSSDRVVIGDPDRDRLWIVDAVSFSLLHEVALLPGDEPGRIAEDAHGTVHVVLRGAGAVVSVDPASGMILRRRAVCPVPRGIAFDSRISALRVACVGGEFVTVPLDDSANTTQLLQPDLRDVVIRDNDIVVSTFRTARVLFFNREMGAMRVFEANGQPRMPERINTFWRMIPMVDGTIAISAQSATAEALQPTPMGYGGFVESCTGTVNSFVLVLRDADSPPTVMGLNRLMPLPVDIVTDGLSLWRVSAANQGDGIRSGLDAFAQVALVNNPCIVVRETLPVGYTITGGVQVGNQRVYFSREPAAALRSDGRILRFESAPSVEHVGHRLFHGNFNNRTSMACASCHPEGGDDGLVWNFDAGSFRTPSLRGTIAGTAPYHWRGEFASLGALTQQVFSRRMGGPALYDAHVDWLRSWLESLPRTATEEPVMEAQQAIDRGSAVFRSDTAGCAGCHSGPRFTNNQTMDVGTGGSFQVPSLVGVRFRAPYMHNGCAASIDARLSDMTCGGRAHGGYGLSAQEKSDLAAYLGSI